MESSRAINCSSVLSQLTAFNKVQQKLAGAGSLAPFLTDLEAQKIGITLLAMTPLDGSQLSERVKTWACNTNTSQSYILVGSPSLGGNYVYGEVIKTYFQLHKTTQTESAYVLMQKPKAPMIRNLLKTREGISRGPVISELSTFGVCLWRRGDQGSRVEMVADMKPGWSFWRKFSQDDIEKKGYARQCIDSPALVTDYTFMAAMKWTQN